MGILTLANDTPLSFLKEEDDLTRSSLEANPLTAALAAPFATFITVTWQSVVQSEQALTYALALATAKVLHADSVLNELVHKLDSALLMLTGKDRTALLYTRYFGEQRPFEVAAGILGPQLEKMRGWIPDLLASPQAILQGIGADIQAAVAGADAAAAAKLAAENAIEVFQTTGERAQAVSAYNALRKETYGELGKLRHQHSGLSKDFPDTFFRHEANRSWARMSPEQIQAKIDALAAQKAVLEKRRQTALDQQKAEAAAKTEAEQKQKQAALAAKKKEKDAIDAAIAKMEAEIVK
jgi:hypothetical protein